MSGAIDRTETAVAEGGGLAARAIRLATGGALLSLSIRVAAAGIGYGLHIGLARMLGAEQYGVFALAWVWVTIGGFAGCLGFSQIAVRFLPAYAERGESGLRQAFLGRSVRVVLAVGLSLGLVGAALALLASRGDGALVAFLLAAACVPVFAYQDLLEGYGRAHGWLGLALVPPYILRQGAMFLGLVLAIAAGAPAQAATAMAVALAATLAATVIQHGLIWRAMRREAGQAGDVPAPSSVVKLESRRWTRAALTVFVGDAALMLRNHADVLLVGWLVPPATLAVYFAATRCAALLGFIEYAVGAMAGHRFARLNAAGGGEDLRRAVLSALKLTFWPTLVAAGALAALASPILSLFGPDFAGGAPIVVILALGHVVRAAVGPADDLLVTSGRERLAVLAQALGLFVNVALILLLVPANGILAAAIAATAATATTTIVLAVGLMSVVKAREGVGQ